MKKLKNNKGFTLIELLAVIVILAILVAVAVPAVTRYLNTARKGTFASNAQAAISVVRNDVISNNITSNTQYDLNKINSMLEKQLKKSPYGTAYNGFVDVKFTNGAATYYICLLDEGGNGFYNGDTGAVSKGIVEESVVETSVSNHGSVRCVAASA